MERFGAFALIAEIWYKSPKERGGSVYILRSYKEVWKDSIREQAGADEVTRLPKRKIGAAYGVYVITGKQHREAAMELSERLAAGMTLAEEIIAANEIDEKYQVAIDIEYGQ